MDDKFENEHEDFYNNDEFSEVGTEDNGFQNKENYEEDYTYPTQEKTYEDVYEDGTHNWDDDITDDVLEDDEYDKRYSQSEMNRSKKNLKVAVAILSVLVFLLLTYVIYSSKNLNFGSLFGSTSSSQTNTHEVEGHNKGESEIKFEPKPTDDRELSAETIYEKLSPCVVGVVVYDPKADIISEPASQGSGIIINEKGFIVTNAHVVGNSVQNNIKIVLNTKEEFPGKVIGFDSKTDIAVIKAEKSGLKAATFGNSDEVKVGSSALALGNPLGLNFASSLTRGIVSAINRCSNGSSNSLVKYIQTDAAINPGNSGGPLINMYGQVIGMNSSKIAAAHCEGMGFAIPSNTIKTVVDDIIDKGYVSGRVRLGISGKMVSNYEAQMYNVPVGVIISEMSKDSNLISAGVQRGDIITKINDVNFTNLDAFYAELYSHKPGENVKLAIYRTSTNKFDSKSFDVTVTLLEDKGETQEMTKQTAGR